MTQSHRGNTILIVDDDPGIRRVMDRLLQRAGYETLLAANGPDALRLYESHAPDIGLVLLDWNLPGTSGRETLAALLQRRSDLRVMLVTGSQEATTDEHATQDTVSILLKPFSHHELVLAVKTLLGA